MFALYTQGPIVVNMLNTSARTPGNPEANDPAQRARLYEEACKMIQEVGWQRLHTVDSGLAGRRSPYSLTQWPVSRLGAACTTLLVHTRHLESTCRVYAGPRVCGWKLPVACTIS